MTQKSVSGDAVWPTEIYAYELWQFIAQTHVLGLS